MFPELRLVIPGEPVGFKRTANYGGRRITPKKQRAWMRTAVVLARQKWGPRPPVDEPCFLYVFAVSKRPKAHNRAGPADVCVWRFTKPDADNTYKLAADALQRARVLREDSRVCLPVPPSLWAPIGQPGRTVIVLRPATFAFHGSGLSLGFEEQLYGPDGA